LEAKEKYELQIDNLDFSKYYQPNSKSGESIPSSFAPKFHTIKEESKKVNSQPDKVKVDKSKETMEFTSGFEKFDAPIKADYSQFKTAMPNKKTNENTSNEQRKMQTNYPNEKLDWNDHKDFEFDNPIQQQISKDPAKEKFATNVAPKTKIFSDLLEDIGPNSGLTNDLFTQINPNINKNIKNNIVTENQDFLEENKEKVAINERIDDAQNYEIQIESNQEVEEDQKEKEEIEKDVSKEEIQKNMKNDANKIFMDLFNDKIEENEKIKNNQEQKEQKENNDDWQDEVFNKIENTISKESLLKPNPKSSLNELQRNSKSPEVKPQFNTNIPVSNAMFNTNPFITDPNNSGNNQFANSNVNTSMNPNMMMYMTNMMKMNMMYNGMMGQQNQFGKYN